MELTRSQGSGRYDQPTTNHWRRLTIPLVASTLDSVAGGDDAATHTPAAGIAPSHWRDRPARIGIEGDAVKRLLLAAVLVVTALSLSATAVLAAAPNPPNCMGKDMGFWAREGSIAGQTGDDSFPSGSGWGRFVAGQAQLPSPFGEANWGQAMVAHLAGDFFGGFGITCQ